MNTPALEYEGACLAGDLAEHLTTLTKSELCELHRFAIARMAENETKGGIPAIIKWACVIEASKRFLS